MVGLQLEIALSSSMLYTTQGMEISTESFDHLEQAYQLIRVASLLV